MQAQEKYAVLIFLAAVFSIYALAVAAAIRSLLGCFDIGSRRINPFQVWYRRIILSLAGLGILCMLYGRFVEPYWLDVRKVSVKSLKLSKGAQPIRIVHISDIHSDPHPRLEIRLPAEAAAIKPDVITYTGDSLNSPEGLPVFKKCLSELAAIAPTYVVKGNWDQWYWYNQDLFGGTGAIQLDATVIRGKTVWLAGIPVEKENMIGDLLQQVPRHEFSIFLYHYPDLVEQPELDSIDLYLAGHTHGGQIALPFYGALATLSKFGKKYEAGTYSVGNTTLNVNRGIGMEGGRAPRVRFFARPEITVIDVSPE